MRNFILLAVVLELLVLVYSHNPQVKRPAPYPYPHQHGGGGGDFGGGNGGGGGGIGGGGGTIIESCPRPSPQSIKCLQEWACQQVIRLDLRCLLNLNGNNLLGNLVSVPGVTGGGSSAGGGGILGGLLGK